MPKRILKGIVISNKQEKTVVVRVSRQVRHPLYKKIIKRSKKYNAHDESNKLNIGDFLYKYLDYDSLASKYYMEIQRTIDYLMSGIIPEIKQKIQWNTTEKVWACQR